MKLTLEALQLIDAIEVRGSFAAAADALHRVPSAVTHAIRRLEEDLGVTLFVRQGRRAVLTEAGHALLNEGRLLLRSANELESRVRRVAGGWESEFRIALQSLIKFETLLPLIEEFDRLACGTRLRISWEVLGGGWDALLSGRTDLSVGVPGDPPTSGFTVKPFGLIDLVFAVAPTHPLASLPEPLPQSEVARYRAIAVADTSRELAARTVGIQSGQDVLTVPDMPAKRTAQVAGLGVGRLIRCEAEAEAAAGRLVIRRVADAPPPEPIYLAWRSNNRGQALAWWVKQLSLPRWRDALVQPLAPDKSS